MAAIRNSHFGVKTNTGRNEKGLTKLWLLYVIFNICFFFQSFGRTCELHAVGPAQPELAGKHQQTYHYIFGQTESKWTSYKVEETEESWFYWVSGLAI